MTILTTIIALNAKYNFEMIFYTLYVSYLQELSN